MYICPFYSVSLTPSSYIFHNISYFQTTLTSQNFLHIPSWHIAYSLLSPPIVLPPNKYHQVYHYVAPNTILVRYLPNIGVFCHLKQWMSCNYVLIIDILNVIIIFKLNIKSKYYVKAFCSFYIYIYTNIIDEIFLIFFLFFNFLISMIVLNCTELSNWNW